MFKLGELIGACAGRLICGSRESVAAGISIDTRTIQPQQAFIAIKGPNFDGHNFINEAIRKGAACIIRETSGRQPAAGSRQPSKTVIIEVKDTVKALGDIARLHRQKFDIPVVAVTGSNGKTTTKEMAACLLSGEYRVLKNEGTKNNHIGLPMALAMLQDRHRFAVLEAGTNHPGEIDYLGSICLPNAAIITNIGPSHLQYLKDERGVLREKGSLLRHLRPPRIAILNSDCRYLRPQTLKGHRGRTVIGFGINHKSDFFASDIKIKNTSLQFLLNHKYKVSLNTTGYYNIYNALAAAALARIFGVSYKALIERLNTFSFPDGRLKIRKIDNISFIDDSYNSNPLSLQHALDVLGNFRAGGRKIFVMGDMLELGDKAALHHRQAGKKAAGVCDYFVAVGRLSVSAAKTARQSGMAEKDVFCCSDSSRARDVLFKKITPAAGDIVLVKGSRAMKMEEVFSKA